MNKLRGEKKGSQSKEGASAKKKEENCAHISAGDRRQQRRMPSPTYRTRAPAAVAVVFLKLKFIFFKTSSSFSLFVVLTYCERCYVNDLSSVRRRGATAAAAASSLSD